MAELYGPNNPDPDQPAMYPVRGEVTTSYARVDPLLFQILCVTGRLHAVVNNLDPEFVALQVDGKPVNTRDALHHVDGHPEDDPRTTAGLCDGGPHSILSATYPMRHAGHICGGWVVAVDTDDPQVAETEFRPTRWTLLDPDGTIHQYETDPTLLFSALAAFVGATNLKTNVDLPTEDP